MTWAEIVAIVRQLETEADRDCFNKLMTGAFCEAPHCERFGELRRQNTAYASDLSNWNRLCEEHQEEANQFWSEQWSEYYRDVL